MEPKGAVFTGENVTRPVAVARGASLPPKRSQEGSGRMVGDRVVESTLGVVPVVPDHQGAAKGVYLDYNGSAPLDPRVAEIMVAVLTKGAGNASSTHRFGRRQAAAVDEAREHVAVLVGGRASNVVFTAGATESNNLALQGCAEGASADRSRIVISAVEHASIRETARWLHERGLLKLDVVPVTAGGYVDLRALEDLLDNEVLLVSVMSANSETGVLNPLAEIAARAGGRCVVSLRRHAVGGPVAIRP